MNLPDEARLEALETALAHQEQTLQELSEVIRRQWDEIETLARAVRKLEETKADIVDADDPTRPPPHY